MGARFISGSHISGILCRMTLRAALLLSACLLWPVPPAAGQSQPASAPAHNVVLVMTDGLRWQEMFRGADASLLTPARYYDGRPVDALKQQFLAPTAEDRRRLLMPFVWSTMVPNGEMWGDRDAGSDASVTNGFNFSYPGYSETLTGHPDPRIHSNDNIPNPNRTVLAWLNTQPGLQGSVAGFGAWEVFDGILDKATCGFPVNTSYAPMTVPPVTPRLVLLNQLKADSPRVWADEVFDAPEFETALEYARVHHPRVLFLSLGETDDWAHAGNYGEYLLSAHRADEYLHRLWTALQAIPAYHGTTTMLFTTDHGRGSGPTDWTSHGEKLPDSKYIFLGMLGLGVPANGLRSKAPPITQNQIAATLARLLGQDWNAAEPAAGPPISLAPDR